VFCIRFIVKRKILSMAPKLFTASIKGHTATCKVHLYTLLVDTHNLCDRVFVSVKWGVALKRKLCSLDPVIYFNH
jgi:hypothetical protein